MYFFKKAIDIIPVEDIATVFITWPLKNWGGLDQIIIIILKNICQFSLTAVSYDYYLLEMFILLYYIN